MVQAVAKRYAALNGDTLDVRYGGQHAAAHGRVGLDQLVGNIAHAGRRYSQLGGRQF